MRLPSSIRTLALGPVLVISNIAILAIIAVAAAQALWASHTAHTQQARQATENLALTLSIGIASDIKQVDNVLLSTRAQLAQAVTARDGWGRLGEIVERNRELLPQIDALRVTDARGRVLNTEEASALTVGDRGYFEAARKASGGLVFSEPLNDRLLKNWGLVLARARTDAKGEFNGVVYAHLPADYFLRAFDDVRVGRHGAVSLRTETLELIARYAPGQRESASLVGSNTVSAELRAALSRDARQGFYISPTAVDGIERANAYRQVNGHPLLIIAGLGTQDFYRPWRREVATTAALAGLLAAGVVGLSVLAYRTHNQQRVLHRSIEQLALEQQAVLDNELVGMVRVRGRYAIWNNRAMSKLFGFALEELNSHPTRMLYPDDASYERIGRAYAALERGEQFRTQLQLRHKDGRLPWIDLSGVKLPNGDSLWMMVDISALKEIESKAQHMALHDPLTGLANRAGLDTQLREMLQEAQPQDRQVAVGYLDLDGFKQVNDTHGHEAGDALLRMAAQRIAACTRSHDVVARMGGDEFVVGLSHLDDRAEVERVVQRILEALAAPFSVSKGLEVRVGASLGIALFPNDGSDAAQLIAHADTAMYAAKRAGKGSFSFFTRP